MLHPPVKGLILDWLPGNLLSDGLFDYTYDSANRLMGVVSGTFTTEYLYNGDGVRVAQIEAGLRTDYVQDVAAPLPQVLMARQGGTVSKYLRGLGLIGEQQGGTGPQAGPAVWQYYLPDALGSVRQVTDPAGQVLLTRRYDPFGGLQTASGIVQSNYGFAGEEQDPASDRLFLRARTYHPATGRFLQADPVLGQLDRPASLHRYAYAFNNPVNIVDPSGLMPPGLGATRAHRYAPTFGSPALPDINYAAPPPTQRSSGYNTMVNPWAATRSVNAAEAARSTYSDPYARQQSQGHLPKPCGLGDILFGLGHAALNGHLLQTGFEVSMHSREFLLDLMPMEMWELSFQLLIGLSVYDWLYDFGSLLTGQDILTGQELTEFDQAAILIGALTFGLGDDLVKAGKALNKIKYADEAATAAKAGQGLNRWPAAQALRNLFEMTSIFKKGFNVGLQELANGVKQKVANGLTKSLANLGSWLKGKLNQVFSGGQLPKGNLPRSSKVPHLDPEEIRRVARQGERALDEYEAGLVRHMGEQVLNQYEAGLKKYVTRLGERALDQYEAGLKKYVTRLGERAMDVYEAQLKRGTDLAQAVQNRKAADFSDMVVQGIPKARLVRPLPRDKFFDLGGAIRAGWRSDPLTDAMIGAGVGFGVEGIHQLSEGDLNEWDLLLAMGTGGVLGGSVGLRKKVAGESYGEAFTQVAAGAGFNTLAALITTDDESDLYIAALIGGGAVPVTSFYERRNKNYEALVNTGVGAFANSVQYSLSQILNGDNIAGDTLLYNFMGGVGPGGSKALMNLSPYRFGKLDDFLVAAASSLTGGFLIPDTASKITTILQHN